MLLPTDTEITQCSAVQTYPLYSFDNIPLLKGGMVILARILQHGGGRT